MFIEELLIQCCCHCWCLLSSFRPKVLWEDPRWCHHQLNCYCTHGSSASSCHLILELFACHLYLCPNISVPLMFLGWGLQRTPTAAPFEGNSNPESPGEEKGFEYLADQSMPCKNTLFKNTWLTTPCKNTLFKNTWLTIPLQSWHRSSWRPWSGSEIGAATLLHLSVETFLFWRLCLWCHQDQLL